MVNMVKTMGKTMVVMMNASVAARLTWNAIIYMIETAISRHGNAKKENANQNK